jgi:predicted transcriptional regulator
VHAHLPQAEADRVEEFAGRFGGWAEALANNYRRNRSLQQTVETLNDRLAHDPELAASVHEVLSTAASIRSTASILVEEKTLDQTWRERFHANINEDSERLALSSKALVSYLDAGQGQTETASSPQEEVEAFLAEMEYDFTPFETHPGSLKTVIETATSLRSGAAREIAREVMDQVLEDIARLPMVRLRKVVGDADPDPVALARGLDLPVSLVLRRLASMPELQAGLVVSDRAGSLIFRKPAAGFVIPRFGAACALWPLFSVLTEPGRVDRSMIVQLGRGRATFACFAIADVVGTAEYNAAPLLRSTMLVLPRQDADTTDAQEVGSNCRVCPRASCAARREPSILSEV